MSKPSRLSHFNKVATMSPIQHQKRLRLIEARQAIINDEENAEGAAFKVGYKSTSQLSREYSRIFGNSPIRETLRIKDRVVRTGVKPNDF